MAFPDFTNATVKYTEADTDKFWLMSYSEALNMFGGGEWRQNELFWPNHAGFTWYWLRSPDSSSSNYAHGVYNYGDCDSDSVGGSVNAARAAFNLAI